MFYWTSDNFFGAIYHHVALVILGCQGGFRSYFIGGIYDQVEFIQLGGTCQEKILSKVEKKTFMVHNISKYFT